MKYFTYRAFQSPVQMGLCETTVYGALLNPWKLCKALVILGFTQLLYMGIHKAPVYIRDFAKLKRALYSPVCVGASLQDNVCCMLSFTINSIAILSTYRMFQAVEGNIPIA